METDALASDRSTGRGRSRQNGMCKILIRVWTAVCLWETCDIVIKAGGRGMKIMSFHVLWKPYGIPVKSSGQGIEAVLGLVFFKICCPHPLGAGVIPMQFQVRLMTALIWYFGLFWYTSPDLIYVSFWADILGGYSELGKRFGVVGGTLVGGPGSYTLPSTPWHLLTCCSWRGGKGPWNPLKSEVTCFWEDTTKNIPVLNWI